MRMWLDHDQLRPYFKTVQQSSVCLIRKPHPAIYYYALEECGSDPKRTCYVGDNLARDIVGAKHLRRGRLHPFPGEVIGQPAGPQLLDRRLAVEGQRPLPVLVVPWLDEPRGWA